MLPETFDKVMNYVIYALGIAALAVLLFFFVAAIVSVVYKGKRVAVKILKKHELKFKRRRTSIKNTKAASRGSRYSRSKVDVEFTDTGDKKTLKCNDFVILDKLSVGYTYNLRVKFGVIEKILK